MSSRQHIKIMEKTAEPPLADLGSKKKKKKYRERAH
jgi:hypothetical protein